MSTPRITAQDAVDLRSFLISEGYDEVAAMAAVLREFNRSGVSSDTIN